MLLIMKDAINQKCTVQKFFLFLFFTFYSLKTPAEKEVC